MGASATKPPENSEDTKKPPPGRQNAPAPSGAAPGSRISTNSCRRLSPILDSTWTRIPAENDVNMERGVGRRHCGLFYRSFRSSTHPLSDCPVVCSPGARFTTGYLLLKPPAWQQWTHTDSQPDSRYRAGYARVFLLVESGVIFAVAPGSLKSDFSPADTVQFSTAFSCNHSTQIARNRT